MAIRDKMVANAQAYLEPGEVVQSVFGAQTFSQWWALLTLLLVLVKNSYVVVVVTDRRILVGKSGKLTTTKIDGILHTLPRSTRIGPARGMWWTCHSLGSRLYVHKRYHRDVAHADSLLGA
jgi:hypothetical protein